MTLTKTKIIKLILPSETLFMTLYDKPLVIAGQTYHPALLIGDITMQFSASLEADTAMIHIIHKHDTDYNNGMLEIYDYELVTHTILSPACFIGKIMATEIYDYTVTLKAYNSKRLLNKTITRTYGTQCQAEWGDNHCKINKDLYKQQIEITSITNNIITYTVLSGSVTDFYNPYLTDSLGNIIIIMNHNKTLRHFTCDPLYVCHIGQTYTLYAGCQKDIQNCNYYNNINNYLGFNKM